MIFDVFRVSGFDVSHIIAFDAPEELFFLVGWGEGKETKKRKQVCHLIVDFLHIQTSQMIVLTFFLRCVSRS